MEQNIEKNNCCSDNCGCEYKKHKMIILVLGMVFLFAIISFSILRERIVNENQNQISVLGTGKVEYQPDEARVTLGVQVDRVSTAQEALRQMNEKAGRVIAAVKTLRIKEEDIKTQSYSLYPQYDYKEGAQTPAGYNASEQLVIKAKNINENKEIVGNIISSASNAGVNNVVGVNYSVSNINDLKQQARLKAIADAKEKAPALIKASGVRVGKILGWYENNVYSPDTQNNNSYGYGIGGASEAKAASTPQVPSGTQEIIIEIGVNYEVK
jgi:uncharacterized protein